MRIRNALWHGALLSLAISHAGTSLAQTTAEAEGSAGAAAKAGAPKSQALQSDMKSRQANPTEAKKAPVRPFIERSLVIAPERVGKFKLYGMSDFPGNPGAGIAIRYQHEDFPSVRIDLYVYPAGRVSRDRVLGSGMQELRATLEHAAAQGKYTDLSIGEQVEFDLRRVDADGALLPDDETSPPAGEGTKETDAQSAIAAAEAAVDYRTGQRLTARLAIQGEPQNSLAFLFYRGLYLVKGRVSASPSLLPDELFDRFANHAMAALVPGLVTRSTGGCSQDEISLAEEDFKSRAALAGKLGTISAIRTQEACAATFDEAIPSGHRAMSLVYAPDMWN